MALSPLSRRRPSSWSSARPSRAAPYPRPAPRAGGLRLRCCLPSRQSSRSLPLLALLCGGPCVVLVLGLAAMREAGEVNVWGGARAEQPTWRRGEEIGTARSAAGGRARPPPVPRRRARPLSRARARRRDAVDPTPASRRRKSRIGCLNLWSHSGLSFTAHQPQAANK
jgi:hypothetical protein